MYEAGKSFIYWVNELVGKPMIDREIDSWKRKWISIKEIKKIDNISD